MDRKNAEVDLFILTGGLASFFVLQERLNAFPFSMARVYGPRQSLSTATPFIGTDTGKVSVRVVQNTDSVTLQGFVRHHVTPGATVYTEEAFVYRGMTSFERQAVHHSVGAYV